MNRKLKKATKVAAGTAMALTLMAGLTLKVDAAYDYSKDLQEINESSTDGIGVGEGSTKVVFYDDEAKVLTMSTLYKQIKIGEEVKNEPFILSWDISLTKIESPIDEALEKKLAEIDASDAKDAAKDEAKANAQITAEIAKIAVEGAAQNAPGIGDLSEIDATVDEGVEAIAAVEMAKPGTWVKSNGKWWYRHEDGSYTTNDWEFIDYEAYYFDADGYMVTGWKEIDGDYYYFEESGEMATYKWVGDYYLGPNGEMLRDTTTPDGTYVDKTGKRQVNKWVESNGKWWYRYANGDYPAGMFEEIDGTTYYFDADGYMVTGWKEIDGDYYYFEGSGAMAVSKWVGDYYLGEDGIMLTNTTTPDGYYVDKDGKWQTDKWVESNGRWWYSYKEGGYPADKFEEIEGITYYFDADGYMVTGWQVIDGEDYYFEGSGAMAVSKWVGNYYLGEDGKMLRSTRTPDGYEVDENGKWVE